MATAVVAMKPCPRVVLHLTSVGTKVSCKVIRMATKVVAMKLCLKAMDLLALVGSFDREERTQ